MIRHISQARPAKDTVQQSAWTVETRDDSRIGEFGISWVLPGDCYSLMVEKHKLSVKGRKSRSYGDE